MGRPGCRRRRRCCCLQSSEQSIPEPTNEEGYHQTPNHDLIAHSNNQQKTNLFQSLKLGFFLTTHIAPHLVAKQEN